MLVESGLIGLAVYLAYGKLASAYCCTFHMWYSVDQKREGGILD